MTTTELTEVGCALFELIRRTVFKNDLSAQNTFGSTSITSTGICQLDLDRNQAPVKNNNLNVS